jgi:acyl carrier protein
MSRQAEIVTTIEDVIRSEFDFASELSTLSAQTPLFKGGLELDSFAIVELISHLESRLAFEFREADFREEHFRTVGSLGELIGRYV